MEPATSELALMAAADGGRVVGDGEHAAVVEPRASSEDIQSVDEDSSIGSAAPHTASPADGVEVAGSSENLHLHRAQAAPPTGGEQHALSDSDVESGGTSTNLRTVTWANSCKTLCLGAHPNCAKWVYAVLFLGGMVLAICFRDKEVSHFSKQHGVNGYNDHRYRLPAESALRVSMVFFGFFTIMSITTSCAKKLHHRGNFWNSNLGGVMLVKIFMLAGCILGEHFIPSRFIKLYGIVGRIGGWLFLAIQLISLTRLILKLNSWHQLNPEKRRWLVKPISILLNFGSFGLMFWLLHKNRSNPVDFAIVIITLVLIVIMILIYLSSEVTAGWLTHGVMIAYVVFMCWTVLGSVPHMDSTKAEHRKGADWLTITSFVGLVLVTAYSTLSTGEDHDWIQINEAVPSENDIPYGYAHFHLVFALGSMYFGMLLVGWNAYQTTERWTADFGWWSVIVRAVNGLLAAVLYIWMLSTPFIWNKRKLVLLCSRASCVPHVTFTLR